jgi:hypothetical protein
MIWLTCNVNQEAIMHQPFQRIFPDHSREAWCRKRRLKKDNPYDLPAGNYCFYDLYPAEIEDPSQIYLLVQHHKSGGHLATLLLEFGPGGVQLSLSPEHLQSQMAPMAFQLVRDTLSQETDLQAQLWQHLQEVGWMHQELQEHHSHLPKSSLLAEMTLRSLAGTMENLMTETHPRQWESLLDGLLHSLKHELLTALHEHLAAQNKVVSLSAVRKQKAARQKPENQD